jgi:hypothetical protein
LPASPSRRCCRTRSRSRRASLVLRGLLPRHHLQTERWTKPCATPHHLAPVRRRLAPKSSLSIFHRRDVFLVSHRSRSCFRKQVHRRGHRLPIHGQGGRGYLLREAPSSCPNRARQLCSSPADGLMHSQANSYVVPLLLLLSMLGCACSSCTTEKARDQVSCTSQC